MAKSDIRFEFSKSALRELAPRDEGYIAWDSEYGHKGSALGVRVMPGGTKAVIVRFNSYGPELDGNGEPCCPASVVGRERCADRLQTPPRPLRRQARGRGREQAGTSSRHPRPIRSGSPTSLTSRPTRAGYTCVSSSICSRDASLVGPPSPA